MRTLLYGTVVKSFKKGFNALLEECGFIYETVEDKHSMTSLRHTYATFALTRTDGKRASMRALAKQMGTSERMIQQHYGHDEIVDYEDQLLGKKEVISSPKWEAEKAPNIKDLRSTIFRTKDTFISMLENSRYLTLDPKLLKNNDIKAVRGEEQVAFH